MLTVPPHFDSAFSRCHWILSSFQCCIFHRNFEFYDLLRFLVLLLALLLLLLLLIDVDVEVENVTDVASADVYISAVVAEGAGVICSAVVAGGGRGDL